MKTDILSKLKLYNPDQLPKLKRVVDLCEQAEKSYDVVSSDFLSPDLDVFMPSILFHYRDLAYTLDGGYDDAEYKILSVYPDYMIDVTSDIKIVDVTYLPKYGEIAHRDVLGAVLGLGLKREVIGDILLEEGHVQIVTSDSIATFLSTHLSKIGRITGSVSIVEKDMLIEKIESFKMISSTVKSLRLDSVISSGHNISRSKAVDYIKAERVKLNHNYCNQSSKELNEGDLISIKGLGRIRLIAVNGQSKKDRYRIEIKKYI